MARKRFTFWLNDSKSKENELIGQVDQLKQGRLFTRTIRQGLELIMSLRDGRLDVLFSLFPWVRAEFMEYIKQLDVTESDSTPVSSAETDQTQALKSVIQQQEQRIAELEAKLSQTPPTPAHHMFDEILSRLDKLQPGSMSIATGLQPLNNISSGIKPIGQATPLPPPDDDDLEMELTVSKAQGNGQAANNFLQSMQALQH